MTRRYTLHKPPAETSSISYEKELNPEQLQVVTSGKGPALVLAGPGSGKTRTLTYRVAYLLEQGVSPQSILLVTFTVKAAREMLERVEKILKAKPEGLWGGTFHHIGNLVLRRHAALLQRTPSFGILDEEDAEGLLSSIAADMKAPSTHIRMPQAGVLETILSMATNTCRPLEKIVLELYPQFSEQIPWMERVRAAYRERKRQANVLDYDDLMSEWLTLLKDHPAVRRQYEEQFQYILVDEYQDTNRLQFELIRALGSGRKNILAVGDDAQSIYGFRGADVRNLLQFPEVFPGAAVYRLETNYRSTPEILRLANASIGFNTHQFPKELKSVQESGSLPVVVPLADARQQAAFIAQRALELREEGIPLEEMAVLFRARFQAAELELELAKRNIPYVVRGGIRFFEQAHIKDVLAYLRILSNPNDEMAWERVLRLQEGIGAGYAKRIREALMGSQNPLQAALGGGEGVAAAGLPSKAQASWKRLRGVMGRLSGAAGKEGPAGLLLAVLKTGYESYLQTHFEDARDRREDLEQLVNLASGYASREKFIEDLTLREPFRGESIRGWEEPDEVLVLSTVHQAKGLEWTAVFLIGLAEGQFPHPKSVEDSAQMEEERRLFYVAVTRAKRDLYLTHPMTRYNYQRGETILRPSQFLQELPETLLELWRVGGEETRPSELDEIRE